MKRIKFFDESSVREKERDEREGRVWNNKGFGFSLHRLLDPSLCYVIFFILFSFCIVFIYKMVVLHNSFLSFNIRMSGTKMSAKKYS